MFIRLGKALHYKVYGLRRKPKRYLTHFIRLFFTQWIGLFTFGILGNFANVLIDVVQRFWNFICRLPFDIRFLWNIFSDILIKLIASLRPSNLWKMVLSLPSEIRHINMRCMAFLTLYWNELRRLLNDINSPRKLLNRINQFIQGHIRNKHRIVRAVIALLCTILLIRLFFIIAPYLYLIVPAAILLYFKPLLPVILNALAGLGGKAVARAIFRKVKKRIPFLRVSCSKRGDYLRR